MVLVESLKITFIQTKYQISKWNSNRSSSVFYVMYIVIVIPQLVITKHAECYD